MIRKHWLVAISIVLLGCNDEASLDPTMTDKGFMKIFTDGTLNNGEMLKVLSDGYILLGNSINPNDGDFISSKLIRLDENGNTLWEKTYNVDGTDQLEAKAIDVLPNNTGYIVIADRINSISNAYSMYLFKVDNNGENFLGVDISAEELTDNAINYVGETHGIDVLVTEDNTIITLSLMDAVTSGSPTNEESILTSERNVNDLSLACSDPRIMPKSDVSLVKSLIRKSDNIGIIVGGYAPEEGNTLNIPNICINSTDAEFLDIPEFTDSYVTNQFVRHQSNIAFVGTINNRICMAVVTEEGYPLRTAVIDEPEFRGTRANGVSVEEGFSICSTSDGGFLIGGSTAITTGTSDEIANESDAIIIKTDGYGNMTWFQKFGNTNEESAVYVEQTADGGYAILTNVEYGGIDMMALIKTNSKGELN